VVAYPSLSLARVRLSCAHDSDNDYDNDSNDNDSIDSRINSDKNAKKLRPLDDGIGSPYIEEELKVRYEVEYVRTPCNETVVFKNARYLGSTRVKNYTRRYANKVHLWRVDFISVDNTDYDEPFAGLLQITDKRWRKRDLPSPGLAFVGTCEVVADKRYEVVSIRSNLGMGR